MGLEEKEQNADEDISETDKRNQIQFRSLCEESKYSAIDVVLLRVCKLLGILNRTDGIYNMTTNRI